MCILISAQLAPQDTKLVVMDSKTKKENPIYLAKFEGETLELTCELKNNTEEETFLKWTLPSEEENISLDRNKDDSANDTSVFTFENTTLENGTLKLFLNNLQIIDSGSYTCSYGNDSNTFNHTVKLIVRPKRDSCGKKFECDENQCIAAIYKCDGLVDCKSKIDESPEICGENPCDGRIMCSNGRCIPKEWCKPCDSVSKENCTNKYRPDCCPPLDPYYHYPKGDMVFGDGSYPQRYNDFVHQPSVHRYDINLIQTTIYTIIGCALVFMIIVSILVIAICRIHMKRSPPVHIPNNRRVFATTSYHRAFTQEIGLYDLDISVNRPEGVGLLVTYNINNGVQIVGSPVDPPPYSEVASLPPREGPPPPYTLSQPFDGNQETCTLRAATQESPPKSGRFLRTGLSRARVSSEPSLLNISNRL